MDDAERIKELEAALAAANKRADDIEAGRQAQTKALFAEVKDLRDQLDAKKDRWSDLNGILVITWDDYERYCSVLHNKILKRFEATGDRPEVILSIEYGGAHPAMRLFMMLRNTWPDLKFAVYNKEGKIDADLTGKMVLAVDDLSRTGKTFMAVREECMRCNVGGFMSAVLIHHPGALPPPLFAAIDIDKRFGVFLPWKSWPTAQGHLYPRNEVE